MRRLDRLIALVLGLGLAAGSILVGIETMAWALGDGPVVVARHRWDAALRAGQWTSSDVVITSGLLAGVGLVLVALQVVRRLPVRLALRSRPGQRAWVSRQGLARRLSADVARLDMVTRTKVRIGRRKVRTQVALSAGTERSAGIDAVRRSASDALGHLGVVRDLTVKVKASVNDVAPVERSR